MNIYTLYRTVSKDGTTFAPFNQAPVKVCTNETNAKATIRNEIKAMDANRNKWGSSESFISASGLEGQARGGNRNAADTVYKWVVTVRALDIDDAPVATPMPASAVTTVPNVARKALAAPVASQPATTEGLVLAATSSKARESHDEYLARRNAVVASRTRRQAADEALREMND